MRDHQDHGLRLVSWLTRGSALTINGILTSHMRNSLSSIAKHFGVKESSFHDIIEVLKLRSKEVLTKVHKYGIELAMLVTILLMPSHYGISRSVASMRHPASP